MTKFKASILTIFPEMFPGPLGCSLAGRALRKGIWSMDVVNIRDFGITKHKNVDDTPMGGGNGLIMRPDVLGRAIDYTIAKNPEAQLYYPSPRGKRLNQKVVKEISKKKNVIFLCGRFEGIDERVIDEYNPVQISVGDYVLSGGEIAAFVALDAVIRLIPGVLANQDTLIEESFECDKSGYSLLEYPLYTKPNVWHGRAVPDVLVSGHHAEINKWRKAESLKITKALRPDLLNK